jgi:hypothetical protein
MKIIVIIVFLVFVITSCKSYRINYRCKDELIHKLEYLSSAILFNKKTKVYTLHHSKLPDLSHDRFLELKDSLENITYLSYDINMVKHFIYCKELESLITEKCHINLSEVQKYYGRESSRGSNFGQVHSLFYFFNNNSYKECYDKNDRNGSDRKCSMLTFKFDENQILVGVFTESFGF